VGVTLATRFERKDGTGAPEMRVGRLPAAKSWSFYKRLISQEGTQLLTKGMTNMMFRKECLSRNPGVLGRKGVVRVCRIPYILPSSA
jgi:hypothetical protein